MNREIIELREVVTKLVPLLAGKGLRVTQRGSQAYVNTDPVTKKPMLVNIPNIGDGATPDFIRAIQGFIDHEVGHVLHTDWNYYGGGPTVAQLRDPKVQRFIHTHNIVEDTMIEKEMAKTFPGSKKNIHDLREHFIEKITKVSLNGAKDDKERFHYLLVPAMRALAGHEEFAEFMDKGKHWANPFVDALVKGLKPATLKALKTATNTKQTLEIAREVHTLLFPPNPPVCQDIAIEVQVDTLSNPIPLMISGGRPDSVDATASLNGTVMVRQHSIIYTPNAGYTGADSFTYSATNEDGTSAPATVSIVVKEKEELTPPPPAPPSPPSPPEEDEDEDDDDQDEGEGKSQDKPEKEADEGDGDGEREHQEPEEDDDGDQDEDDEGPGAAGDAADGEDDEPDEEAEGADDEDGAPADGETSPKEDEDLNEDEAEGAAGADDGDSDGDGDKGEDEEAGPSVTPPTEGETGEASQNLSAGEEEVEANPEDGSGVGSEASKSMFDFEDDAFENSALGEAIAQELSKAAVEAMEGDDEYNVFTREFDRIESLVPPEKMDESWVPAMEDKVRQMTGVMQKDIERLMASQSYIIRTPGHRKGSLHAPSLYRVPQGDSRVFSQRQEHKSKDTAVTLLCDNSGSMRGVKMKTAMEAAYALSTTLERVNISHEVIGFTTGGLYGLPKDLEQAYTDEVAKSGIIYDRVVPIVMPIYKDFDERVTAIVKKRIAYAANQQNGLAGNIDGESLEYAAVRLLKRREKRKVMLVLSDGWPAGSHKSGPHLSKTVIALQKLGIDTVGIGIMDDSVRAYYPKHVVLNRVEDLPGQVMGELKKILA